MKLVYVFLLVNSLQFISAQNEAHELGYQLMIDSFKTLIYGEPVEQSYKDIFIDTSKNVFSLLETSNDQVTVDDLLRITIQSVLILIANRRADLIPTDFNQRHVEYGEAIQEINKILDSLSKKGTESVTLLNLRKLLKIVKSNEFWNSIKSLRDEVVELIEQENDNLKQEL